MISNCSLISRTTKTSRPRAKTSTSVSSCYEQRPVGWRPMRKPGSHCANKRSPFATLRSARRCTRTRRFRDTAGYFQQKTTELHALNRSVEEIRTRLVTQIDRLEKLKIQLEFNRTTAQIGEAVKGGEVSLDNIRTITADAQRIAADLDGFGRASAVVTEPAEAAKPVDVKSAFLGL